MIRARGLGLALLLAGLVGACAPASSETRAPLPDRRPRIMSMNPCIDAILFEVADPDQILSISDYSKDPASSSVDVALARRFLSNAGTAEEAVAARPDLILIGPHQAPATLAALRRAGIGTLAVGVPASIAESEAQIMEIARAAGQEARGRALVQRIERALAAAAPPGGRRPVSALVRMSGGLVPGPGSLASELLSRTGFRDASMDYGTGAWDMLPLERMIARPPELLLTDVPDSRHPASLRVARFPRTSLYCAGPNIIAVAARLHAVRRAVAGS